MCLCVVCILDLSFFVSLFALALASFIMEELRDCTNDRYPVSFSYSKRSTKIYRKHFISIATVLKSSFPGVKGEGKKMSINL